ncbi:MAG: type VI secretion system baseplate subunit TssG [Planctomycetota bacterium]|jgi:type VI secretion system protein ImpH
MAAEDGAAAHTIERDLRDGAFRFGFYEAVRRLECARPASPGVGKSEHPREDAVRFCQDPSLAFSPSALARYVPAGADHPSRLFVNFTGLCGPNGPLPLHLTAYLHDRVHNHNDTAMARFLDVFNHRMISLFYRGWAVGQQALSRDRPDDDTFDRYVGSLIGIGMKSFLNADAVPDEAKRHFAGHLASQARNAEGLEGIIRGYFGVPAQVVEFVGRWMTLAGGFLCRLGLARRSETLGASAVLGSRVWECQHKFRIRLGPMTLADYERLLPRTPSFRRLADWVRNYLADELIWDAVLVLRAEEVPRVRLGSYGRLGWTTWLASGPFDRDPDDLAVGESQIEALCGGRKGSCENG